jgi:predicted TPR repeat methyltransferase
MSSGNLNADRRYAYAQSLREEDDYLAAADILTQALELAPQWPEGRFALAETLADAGKSREAIAAYHAYLSVDPTDSMGAGARLALLGEATPADLPAAYVTRLFDEYAPRFDAALTDKLNYRGPALLREAVERVAPGPFSRVFDLGCGTGLSGAAFRDSTHWLGGVDLSPAMIKRAVAKNLYDQLELGDIMVGLKNLAEPCDLIIAADVLVYVGELAPLIALARCKTKALAFTVQRAESGTYCLGREQRYSHSRDYLMDCALQADFAIAYMEDAITRQEAGRDVPGLVAVLV